MDESVGRPTLCAVTAIVLTIVACAHAVLPPATESPTGRVSTTVRRPWSETPVPLAAPDSTPIALWDSIIDPANIIIDPPGITGKYIRDLVHVGFVVGATQADRQAAINSVRGNVVGGIAIGHPEHLYAVRLEYVLQPGDSVSGPILRAVDKLKANPKVAGAFLVDMIPFGSNDGQMRLPQRDP